MNTQTDTKPITLGKVKTHAFGKDVYLLGIDKYGDKLWLEAAKWDCGWYWGFGYIERYTNNNRPDLAKDISSHTHWDSEIVGKHEQYDSEKQCFTLGSDYIHHLNEHPNIKATTLSYKESWELADLMQSFYTLKEAAEAIGRGSSHVSSSSLNYQDKAMAEKINQEMLPKVFARIYEILTPIETLQG